jgi:hypothetical protein
MKAGELFSRLTEVPCGLDVCVLFDGKTIRLETVNDQDDEQIVFSTGEWTEPDEDEDESEDE